MVSGDFESLLSGYVDDMLALAPVRATALGVPGRDDMLDDRAESTILANRARMDEWGRIFDAVDPAALTPDEQIDRDLVRTSIRDRQLLRARGGYKSSPAIYVNEGLSAVTSLFTNRPAPETELVRCAIARMRVVPAILANGEQQLDPDMMSSLAAERAARVATSAADYYRTVLPGEASEARHGDALADAAGPVIRAYETFARSLTRVAAAARGEWAYGEELYSSVLRDSELLPFDASELLERGRAAYADATAALAKARAEIGGVAREQLASLQPFTTPDERIDYLQARVDAARDFCATHRLVSLPPGEVCEVRPMPAHNRVVTAVAGYRQPPPFATGAAGALLVPGRQARDGEPVTHGRAAGSDSMVTHEAYPGHHTHMSRARHHGRVVRHLHGSSFLREGWGLYAEKLMHSHGFFEDPVEQLAHLRAVRFRAARVILDVGLHTGRMERADAVAFMRDELGSRAETARLEVERYCSNPVQAVSYYAGCLAIEEMRDRYLAQPGTSLLDFHDRLTASGSLPLALAERALFSSRNGA